jgi:hypothetical protein
MRIGLGILLIGLSITVRAQLKITGKITDNKK